MGYSAGIVRQTKTNELEWIDRKSRKTVMALNQELFHQSDISRLYAPSARSRKMQDLGCQRV